MFVRYRVKDARDWYMSTRSPRDILEAKAYRLLGENIRTKSVFWVIGPNRQDLAQTIGRQIQQLLDDQKVGLEVLQVNLLNAHPPTSINDDENVALAYLEVFNKLQVRRTVINQAQLQAVQQLNDKAAESIQILNQAEGQRWETILTAAGRTERFRLIIKLIKDNPEYLPLVRNKLFLNAMYEALGEQTGKVVIDPAAVDGQVELWLQYPRKQIPFVDTAPVLTPPTLESQASPGN
jgi:membrane protease subunit HflK